MNTFRRVLPIPSEMTPWSLQTEILALTKKKPAVYLFLANGLLIVQYDDISATDQSKMYKKCHTTSERRRVETDWELHITTRATTFGMGQFTGIGYSFRPTSKIATLRIPPFPLCLARPSLDDRVMRWDDLRAEAVGGHPSLLQEYKTEAVRGLVQSITDIRHPTETPESRRPHRLDEFRILPILADALEDAGYEGPLCDVFRDHLNQDPYTVWTGIWMLRCVRLAGQQDSL